MCRMPDSRPMRLVKKWLRGGGGTATKTAVGSRPSTGGGNRGVRACGRWRRRSSAGGGEACSKAAGGTSLSGKLAAFCWRRRKSERDVDDELQQTIALVGRCQPFCVAPALNDDQVKCVQRLWVKCGPAGIWASAVCC